MNKYAPTFPPTSIDYSVYPWLDPNAKHPQEKDGIDQNALTYLMVGSNKNPLMPVGLSYSGTFVNENGLYCMNRDIFWKSWLLKQFGKVLKSMELIPDEPIVEYDRENRDYPWADEPMFHFGNKHGVESDYVFEDRPFDQASWWIFPRWRGSSRKSEKKVDGDDNDHGWLDESSYSVGDYYFDASHETVTVCGGNVLDIYVGHNHTGERS